MTIDHSKIATTQPLISFRVHYVDDTKLDVPAMNADHARQIAEEKRPGKIEKVKRIRENNHG